MVDPATAGLKEGKKAERGRFLTLPRIQTLFDGVEPRTNPTSVKIIGEPSFSAVHMTL
jgi:hypothetical protein